MTPAKKVHPHGVAALEAKAAQYERSLQRIVDIANEGGATELTMDCAKVALKALGEISDDCVGEGEIDRLRAKLAEYEQDRERVRGSDLLRQGGEWLGTARNWLKWHKRNGDQVTWGSNDVLEGPFTVREVEELAADVAAAAMAPQPSENRLNATLRARWKAEMERDEALAKLKEMESWSDDDRPLPEDEQIRAAYPTRSGSHETYAEATRFVGAKRSKASLVALVNWLLVREAAAIQRAERAEALLGEAVEMIDPMFGAWAEQPSDQWRLKVRAVLDASEEKL